jgi:energy-coupling factor transporter transmembrane protein EcfT
MTLLLGFLTFLSLGWKRTDNRIISVLKVVIFVAALAVSVVSLTRGGWLVFPFFIWIGVRLFKLERKNLLILCGIMALLFSSLFFFSSNIQSRFTDAINDISQYEGEKTGILLLAFVFSTTRRALLFSEKVPCLALAEVISGKICRI